jgi:hypothetical protein
VLARVIAAVSAVIWGVLNFGVIDLATAVLRDPVFAEHYILELGWGLLYLVLVAVPFAALVVRPAAGLMHWQVAIVAVSLAVAAALAGQPGHLVPAVALGLTAAALWLLGGAQAPVVTWRATVPLGIACCGVVAWSWYAVTMARSTGHDEVTNQLTHLPAQAALGFALGLGSVSVAVTSGARSHRVELVIVTGSALLLGVESVVNPELLGSLGTLGGAAAVVWSGALAIAVLLPGRSRAPAVQGS